MNIQDFEELNRLRREKEVADRDYRHLIERRAEIENRQVRNQEIKDRFLARLNRDIADAYEQLQKLELALEGVEGAGPR